MDGEWKSSCRWSVCTLSGLSIDLNVDLSLTGSQKGWPTRRGGTAAEFSIPSAKGAECGSVDGLAYSRLPFMGIGIIKIMLTEIAIVKDILSKLLLPYR